MLMIVYYVLTMCVGNHLCADAATIVRHADSSKECHHLARSLRDIDHHSFCVLDRG